MTEQRGDLDAALRRVRCAIEWPWSEEEAQDLYQRLATTLLFHDTSGADSLSISQVGPPDSVAAQVAQELASLEEVDLSLSVQLVPCRVPAIGLLVDLVRAPFHRLSLFYVRRLAERQAVHNRQVARILRLLADRLDSLERSDGPESDAPAARGA